MTPARRLLQPVTQVLTVIGLLAASCGEPAEESPPSPSPSGIVDSDWPVYGRDPGGSQYSPLDQINRQNVSRLEVAWEMRTGEFEHPGEEVESERAGACSRCHGSNIKFETTPVIGPERLYVSTPTNKVLAVDPGTGSVIWRFDPGIDLDIPRNEGFISRGVSLWRDPERETGVSCGRVVFLATVDARLIALDAETGMPCEGFGDGGTVRLDQEVGEVQEGQYGVTSPPALIGDIVVVGSAIGDNRRVDDERGTVQAFDARTGTRRWSWDPIPREPGMPGWETWTPAGARATGAANAWAPLSVDEERNLVFVPTGSASPDFYGGERPGENLFANSVVSLDGSTGMVVWHFQTIHHDLWDYDVASQPTLVSVTRDGTEVPAVVVATKVGHLFVLHRETGEPLFPVEERPVPASTVEGEQAWPTQPFPVLPPPLHPSDFGLEQAWGLNDEERVLCRQLVEGLRNEGVFTPPSTEGTLMYPGFGGGMNWGGVAVDPARGIAVTTVLRVAMWVRLHPRDPGATGGNQRGTPYTMTRAVLVSPSGTPCNPPPWGTLVAVDLETGEIVWERPLGDITEMGEDGVDVGTDVMGGPIVTGGGLVFIGASRDDAIRAFDIETGEELWQADLPAGGQATPMTYEVDGRQHVVIAAGGHGIMGTTPGDYLVAFALPEEKDSEGE